MANIENLKPIRTESEAREKGKKGGIKSGEVRREKKKIKDELLTLLDTVQDNETMRQKMSFTLIQKAINGDLKAFEIIRDTIGEHPDKIKEPTPFDDFFVF